jgi:hypothetical protein
MIFCIFDSSICLPIQTQLAILDDQDIINFSHIDIISSQYIWILEDMLGIAIPAPISNLANHHIHF